MWIVRSKTSSTNDNVLTSELPHPPKFSNFPPCPPRVSLALVSLLFFFLYSFFPLSLHAHHHTYFLSPSTFQSSLSSEQIRWISSPSSTLSNLSFLSQQHTPFLEREKIHLMSFPKASTWEVWESEWVVFTFHWFQLSTLSCLSHFSMVLFFWEILLF